MKTLCCSLMCASIIASSAFCGTEKKATVPVKEQKSDASPFGFIDNFMKDFDDVWTRELPADDTAKLSVKEYQDEARAVYGLNITLPGYDQADIKVNISKKETKGTLAKKMLEIIAEKAIPQEKTEEKNGTKIVTRQSSVSYSATVINGKKREIRQENGKVTITIALENTIDEDDYTMKFKDNVLTIEFKKLEKAPTKKSLQFS